MAHHDTPLARSLAIQARVVGALLMREILTRFGRHNIGFLWIFFEPMMFTLGVLALWTITKATHGSNLPITEFAVTGYSPVLLWRNCANRCALAIQPNQALLYHRNVRVVDFFFARLLLEISGATMSFTFLTIFFIVAGMMHPPENMMMVLGAWLHLAAFGSGLALVIGALSERSESVERIWHTVAYLLFPLSGSLFMVAWLPEKFQNAVLLLPMVHGTEMLRGGYFGSLVTPHYSIRYMVFSDLILLLIGLYFVRDAGRKVEPE
ncbi:MULTISPECIES: ABC transporter permease [Burkholderia]|uniref:ABC transporter permease n=2 Tax=Burkholderia humptydooensis TaxID=430531 RepID=A0A7U4P279_9BURK|nr:MULTISPECIES: ABC transporter permease [Burkholderia]AGK46992.1 ABC-2 type transporter family protein [Burkholderia thailandensis MSMB121]ATF35981.1 sugar ABC transporter permease [Burkholderia thailandensis]AJY42372.1 ABC-2 type transporter family protein [Burkholderia sp. 2002721687]ALX41654.1 sugar ABC transporter permease [Burkholderia humptydooensis]EIP88295.1 ctrC protein [Burkholderia humptydooensis MSMB43]